MLIRVKKVRYLCEYKLEILFSNGKTKIVDFANWIAEGGVYFKPLKNVEFFKKVQLDDCAYTICWPNGADFCPDVLYAVGQEVVKKRVRRKLKKTSKVVRRQSIRSTAHLRKK